MTRLGRRVTRVERVLCEVEGRCRGCGGLHFGDWVSAALCGVKPPEKPCRCACCRTFWTRLEVATP